MNSPLKLLVLTVLMAPVIPALADEAPSGKPVKTHTELMDECLAKQRAAQNGRTEKAMRKACEAQLQTLQNHPSIPDSPKDAPQK
jgi:hypothetical protein